MALQGSLNTMSVSDLLQFLAVSRKTGLLKFSQQKAFKRIRNQRSEVGGRKAEVEVRDQRSRKKGRCHTHSATPLLGK
jgi:hypothetical protein